jgi:hypothetical protein
MEMDVVNKEVLTTLKEIHEGKGPSKLTVKRQNKWKPQQTLVFRHRLKPHEQRKSPQPPMVDQTSGLREIERALAVVAFERSGRWFAIHISDNI